MSFHKVTLIGRLGGDPQMRYTPDGTPVTNFSVATSQVVSKDRTPTCPSGWKESYNGKNWELTTWFRVACWRGLAETTNQYLAKGREVYIEGVLNGDADNGSQNPRVWSGDDGVARASYEITARTVQFVGGRDNGNGGPPVGAPPPEGFEEDSIPF